MKYKHLLVKITMVISSAITLVFAFQNCSKVQFAPIESELSLASQSKCLPQQIEINGTCQDQQICSAPAVLNFLDNSCVCNSPNFSFNGVCQAQVSCPAPGVLNKSNNTCECNSPNLLINGVCQTPVSCASPSVLNRSTNTCECNSPNLLINGVCQAPVSCTSPSVLNSLNNTCVCNSPNLLVKGVCKPIVANCLPPGVLNPTTNTCACNSPNLLVNGSCQTPVSCASPSVLNSLNNTCACNSPNLLINGVCQAPVSCTSPSVLNSLKNTCACNSPNLLVNGVCKAPVSCPAPGVLNKSNNTCDCNSPNLLINGACQTPVSCTSPSVLNRSTNTCECNSPNLLINGVCQAPVSCTSPSVLNSLNNTCACNAPNLLINRVCQTPVSCPAPGVLNKSNNTCDCNSPNLLINGVCQAPVSCTSPSVLNTSTNTCACNSPNLLINGVCKAPVNCPSDQQLDSSGQCKCTDPNQKKAGDENKLCVDNVEEYACMTSVKSDSRQFGGLAALRPSQVSQVRYAYCLIFGRDPANKLDKLNNSDGGDMAGLYYWTENMSADSRTLNDVARDFIKSTEFQDRVPALTTLQFVTGLYPALYFRAPDVSGSNFWQTQISSMISQAEACPASYTTTTLTGANKNKFCAYAKAFEANLLGAEFKTVQFTSSGLPMDRKKSVEGFYLNLLGRPADTTSTNSFGLKDGGIGQYMSLIDKNSYPGNGSLDITQILTKLYTSPEGMAILHSKTRYDLNSIPVQLLVTDMYNRFYLRDPLSATGNEPGCIKTPKDTTQCGQAFWEDQLNKNPSRSQWPVIIRDFIKQQELRTKHPSLGY